MVLIVGVGVGVGVVFHVPVTTAAGGAVTALPTCYSDIHVYTL